MAESKGMTIYCHWYYPLAGHFIFNTCYTLEAICESVASSVHPSRPVQIVDGAWPPESAAISLAS